MSNNNGKGRESIRNRNWNANNSSIDQRAELNDRIEAAKARKAKRLKELKEAQAASIASNDNDNSDNSTKFKFISDYKEKSRRWTTNTTTTRFLPPRKDKNKRNNNNTTNNSNSNNNDNTSIPSNMFTNSFLFTHRNYQANYNLAQSQLHSQNNNSNAGKANTQSPPFPLQQSQQQQMSQSTQNARTNTPTLNRPIQNRALPAHSSPIMRNPMDDLNNERLNQLAQQRHAHRIFHATPSNSGRNDRALSIASNSSFGISNPPTIDPSVISEHDTHLKLIPTSVDDQAQLLRSFNDNHKANRKENKQNSKSDTIIDHNHNRNDKSSKTNNDSNNISSNINYRDTQRDPRLQQQDIFGHSSFEKDVSPTNDTLYNKNTTSNKSNKDNNNHSDTRKVTSFGNRRHDPDKKDPTNIPPASRVRMSLAPSTIAKLDEDSRQKLMNDTTFLQHQANILGEPVIWNSTQSDTGVFGINFRHKMKSRVSTQRLTDLFGDLNDKHEEKEFHDQKQDDNSNDLSENDLKNINNRKKSKKKHKHSSKDEIGSQNEENSIVIENESKDEQLSRVDGHLQFQPKLTIDQLQKETSTKRQSISLISHDGDNNNINSNSNDNDNNNSNKINDNANKHDDNRSIITQSSMHTIRSFHTVQSEYSVSLGDVQPGTMVGLQNNPIVVPNSPHKDARHDDFKRIKDIYRPIYNEWRKIYSSNKEKKVLSKFFAAFKNYHQARNQARPAIEKEIEGYAEKAKIYIDRYNDNEHYKLFESITVKNGPVVEMLQEANNPEADALILELDEFYQQFRDTKNVVLRNAIHGQIYDHINKMIKWKHDFEDQKRQANFERYEKYQQQEKELQQLLEADNEYIQRDFAEYAGQLSRLMSFKDRALYNKFATDLDNYMDTQDLKQREILLPSLKTQLNRVKSRIGILEEYRKIQGDINKLFKMAEPFKENARIQEYKLNLNNMAITWRDADDTNRPDCQSYIDRNSKEMLDLIQRLEAEKIKNAIANKTRYDNNDDDQDDDLDAPINPYLVRMKTPKLSPLQSTNNNDNSTTNNNTNTNDSNNNKQTNSKSTHQLPNNRKFVKFEKELSPLADFDTSSYDEYRQRERMKQQPTLTMTIQNQPKQKQSRVYDPGTQSNKPNPLQSTFSRSVYYDKPTNKQTPSFQNDPTIISGNQSTQRQSVSTQITPQDPVVLQPILAPIPLTGLNAWQRASQIGMHNIQQQVSNNNHHVGVLVEHLLSRDNRQNQNQNNNHDNSDLSSLQQHLERERNKKYAQKRVDTECILKLRKRLPISHENDDGNIQVDVLEWFQDVMDFIEKNDKTDSHINLLQVQIAEKGMQSEMYKKFTEVVRDFGEFQAWDDFARWIFHVHRLNGKCMVTLQERFGNIKLNPKAKPDDLLKPFKKWEDLVIIALRANPDLEKYYHQTEQDLVGRAFGKIPKSYMDLIKPIQYKHGGFEPDDWEGLQALIDAAAAEKIRQGDRDFDPWKSKPKKKPSNDALIGIKVNVAQRGRGQQRRKFKKRYGNQGNRGRYDKFFNNQNDKRGNKYDNQRNKANRSGRGGNTSDYRARGTSSARRATRARGRSRNRGRGRGRGGRGRGTPTNNTQSKQQRKQAYERSNNLLKEAYRNDDCFKCKIPGHWKTYCDKLTNKQKNALRKRALRDRKQINTATTKSKDTKSDKQHQSPKQEQIPKIEQPHPHSTYRTEKKPTVNVARQPLHLHINSTTDPEQVSRVLAGITNPRTNPTH